MYNILHGVELTVNIMSQMMKCFEKRHWATVNFSHGSTAVKFPYVFGKCLKESFEKACHTVIVELIASGGTKEQGIITFSTVYME